MPSEDRLRPHDACYLFERSPAELFSDLNQGSPFAVGQAQTALELISKNSILGNEVLIPQEQLLITDPVMYASIVVQSIASPLENWSTYWTATFNLIAKSSKHENAKQPHWAQARSSCWGTRSPPL